MLNLTRRRGERIRITTASGDVWVTVISIDRNKVQVAIDAPKSCLIDREERLTEEGQCSQQPSDSQS